uniref:Receptor kinase-like protein Xa21 n=1 Tax=Oryza nivara TaxID=4536 RepID=A0A0E0HSW4_ORYNI
MAPLGSHSIPVLVTILLACFSCFLITAFSLVPTAPLHDASDTTDFQALLCLKLHLNDNAGVMASWRNDSSQYCQWPGVTCSKSHTSRVTELNLESSNLHGQIPPCIGNLTFLTIIHLPFNLLTGNIPPEIGHLRRLTYLNLTSNGLTGTIPEALSSCSNLQIIDLSNNTIDGEIPSSMNKCSNLQAICLFDNKLQGVIPEGLGTLSNLSVLYLSNNNLSGNIPFSLGSNSFLNVVILTNNSLTGGIPPLLANINNFVGSIPPISNISSPLWYLSLSQNNLSGSIPSSIENLSSLEILYLSQNNFQGTIPSSLSRIPNLQELDLTYNNLSGTVPASLYNMSNLVYLGMGTNKLIGEIPDNIGYTLPNIKTLILQGNQFQGQIPTSLGIAKNLQVINLRDNAFHGIIPSFGNLPDLMELNLGMNRLEAGDWSFLSSLITSRQLVQLCLDKNILKGTLPSSIAKLSTSLQVLLLTGNEISGTIPQEIEKLTSLTLLYMEKNLLTGNLPDSLGNLPNLFILSLSQNKISGQIPPSFGNLSHLSELYLQENNLSGPIPSSLGSCKNLEALNLSCNSFDSSIPKELVTLSSLSEWLDLSHNQLDGEIPSEIGGLINLDVLNISNNRLSGQIPSALGDCVHLSSLRMEGNLLDGRIPNSFINLRGIVPTEGIFQNASEVFIQGNKKLCGTYPLLQLPLCNVKQSKGKHTNKILRIVGPIAICLALTSCLVFILLKKRNKVKQASDPSCKELKTFTYADIVKATNGFALANLVGSGKYGSVYKGRFEFEEQPVAIKVFKLDQVGAPKCFLAECEALRNTRHRNLVRVITACSTCDPRGHEFKALILEYMANGSLESWLYPKVNKYGLEKPLSLGYRIKIAVDIASALDYLHNYCIPPMVHCDLKPNNILLDDVMGARLGDFGLAKFLQSNSSSKFNSSTSLAGPRGSIGYIAPEYGYGSKVSVEGDVYSYGIIILEMLTGKTPTDQMFSNGLNIRKYVESTFFSHKIGEILDPNIIPNFEEDTENNCDPENHVMTGMLSCVMQLAKLGISCSMETPKDRPAMQDVYAEVIAIKEAFSALRV